MNKKVEYVLQRSKPSSTEWYDYMAGDCRVYTKEEFQDCKKNWQKRDPKFSYKLLIRTSTITEEVIE